MRRQPGYIKEMNGSYQNKTYFSLRQFHLASNIFQIILVAIFSRANSYA